MATPAQWFHGARARTLPAALAPVLAGTAVATWNGVYHLGITVLCVVVALALQVGVNYANDYSDGIRGTDENRVGPMRLVGSGAAAPRQVKYAAFGAFSLAAASGLVVVWLSGHWWLLIVGLASIAAGWFYTGGSRPYGYLGLGEVFVFVFFGLVAVNGTVYVLLDALPWYSWLVACAMGMLASAILVANNLRDLATDVVSGKRTLATLIGEGYTRILFVALGLGAFALIGVFAWWTTPRAGLAFIGLVPLVKALKIVGGGAKGARLIAALQLTGIAELLAGIGLLVGCVM